MATPSPADPLGYDVAVLDDLDPTGRSATGLELVDASILHRLQCDRIEVIEAPGDGWVEFGVDVRKWIGEVSTPSSARAKVPLMDAALQLDPRIAKTSIELTLAREQLSDGSTTALVAKIAYTTVAGQTVSRVVGISAVTVEFLATGGG